MSKIVIALGGNALQRRDSAPTAEAQLEVVRQTCEHIAEISASGYELAIVHGNGPQVGRILLASETAREVVPPMPFDVCGAMSQGYIGYHIQQALRYALAKRNMNYPVVSIVTQMVVERDDPAFQNPTKPIGPFYTKAEAETISEEKGYAMKEDAGRGWRRVVASPLPRKIVEIDQIRQLWDKTIVITCGGGGVPVVENPDGTLEGVAAVIDKDSCRRAAGGADGCRRADDPHRGGKGGHPLGKAEPKRSEPSVAGRGRPIRRPGPLCSRQYAAQGTGLHGLCALQSQPEGHHHLSQ